jgi:ATP-dependent exoDNAse (exonuclease V) alpha subunit
MEFQKSENGEEIVTKNYAEIYTKVIKAKMNAIVLRNMIEQYQVLHNALFELEFRGSEEYKQEVYTDFNSNEESLDRFKASLIYNIRSHY